MTARRAHARVKRRPAVGEASSSSSTVRPLPAFTGFRKGSAVTSLPSARAFSASSSAIRSGVSSPAFSSSILRQPLGALGGLGVVDLDLAAVERLVDLGEESVDELLLRHLPQRLAVGEDQALVLGAR